MGRLAQLLLVVLLLPASQASGLCLDGRRPTVREEFDASQVVAIGSVLSERTVSSPEDPEGFEETIYRFKPSRVLKGRARGTIDIHSPNTSSRFPMERGREYLVFLGAFPGGRSVDACGNSAPSRNKRALVRKVRKMASTSP